jgi:hypothetical protein
MAFLCLEPLGTIKYRDVSIKIEEAERLDNEKKYVDQNQVRSHRPQMTDSSPPKKELDSSPTFYSACGKKADLQELLRADQPFD